MKKRYWMVWVAAILLLSLIPTLALAADPPSTIEIPSDAAIEEVSTWEDLKSGIEGISSDGNYAFQITADLTADDSIQLPQSAITFQVYIYCEEDHSIGRSAAFSDPMFIMGKNGTCNASVTLAFGGIKDSTLTISDSDVLSTGVIYGWGGIGADSAVVLYDGVVFEDNEISNSLWEFAGWKSSADGKVYSSEQVSQLNITQDITFTAQYKSKGAQNTCTVTFKKGTTHGSLSGTTSYTLTRGAEVPDVPNTNPLNGFAFDCWVAEDGQTYTSDAILATEFSSDQTFTARWKKTDGTITVNFYKGDRGFNTSSGGDYYGDYLFAFVAPGGSVKESDIPQPKTISGYHFAGWLSSDGTLYTNEQLTTMEITEQFTLTPQYARNDGKITVSFNGGDHGKVTSGATVTLSKDGTIAGSGNQVPTVILTTATTGGTLIYSRSSNMTVRMYGGKIRNNTVDSPTGGVINANNFEMHGGAIEHNKVSGFSSHSIAGGGVNCDTLIMTGGSVSNNTLQVTIEGGSAYGAGLYVDTSAATSIEITGGTIQRQPGPWI